MSEEAHPVRALLSKASAAGNPGYWDWPEIPVKWHFESGLPDPATFPIDDLVRISERVLREDATEGLQYGGGRRGSIMYGYEGLRELLVERTARIDGRALDLRHLMLTAGGVQAITAACHALLDEGDVVAVEAPTWGAAITAARIAGAEPIAIPMDADGMRVDLLEQEIEGLAEAGKRLKLVYTIATFHTPTGTCLSLERRKQLLALARRHQFIILEDNCYGELRYAGEAIPSLLSLDTEGWVLKVDTFSKLLAPAFRIGWVTGHEDVIGALSAVRGDLGVSQWMARVLAGFMEEDRLEPHIAAVNRIYGEKLRTAVSALQSHCAQYARWSVPDGGYFLWLELDDAVDVKRVMKRAIADGVVCRPGERFFGDAEDGRKFLRMAFAMVPNEELERGIAVLGKAISDSVGA
jgi:2-aminoadipate transaminase